MEILNEKGTGGCSHVFPYINTKGSALIACPLFFVHASEEINLAISFLLSLPVLLQLLQQLYQPVSLCKSLCMRQGLSETFL